MANVFRKSVNGVLVAYSINGVIQPINEQVQETTVSKPLINQFTKTLRPCSGCRKTTKYPKNG